MLASYASISSVGGCDLLHTRSSHQSSRICTVWRSRDKSPWRCCMSVLTQGFRQKFSRTVGEISQPTAVVQGRLKPRSHGPRRSSLAPGHCQVTGVRFSSYILQVNVYARPTNTLHQYLQPQYMRTMAMTRGVRVVRRVCTRASAPSQRHGEPIFLT